MSDSHIRRTPRRALLEHRGENPYTLDLQNTLTANIARAKITRRYTVTTTTPSEHRLFGGNLPVDDHLTSAS